MPSMKPTPSQQIRALKEIVAKQDEIVQADLAEIARLREVIRIAKDALRGHDPEQPYMKAIRAALKPDTGEWKPGQTVTINAKVGFMSPDYEAALKPNTGEKP